MIVAFEGIDGAGKTTTAPLVAARLLEWGYPTIQASKRESAVSAPFAQEQLRALADRLWRVPHDERLATLGTLHWIYLNAAFFAGTHFALSEELGPRGVAIFDNWINKFVARIASNGEFKLDQIIEMLEPLPQPDMVFLLDVEPAVAAHRKAVISDLEAGRLRGATDFVAYQSIVRDHLMTMAERFRWVLVNPEGRSADEVASEVAAAVRARIDAGRGSGDG